jgi:hypothetical protein
MAACILYKLVVRGRGSFPIDMLRYDGCWPYNETDSHLIQQDPYSEPKDERTVTLKTHGDRRWSPSVLRWKSFGWTVVKFEAVP